MILRFPMKASNVIFLMAARYVYRFALSRSRFARACIRIRS
jgi:hypothetical protein